jgi:hypothetical protein
MNEDKTRFMVRLVFTVLSEMALLVGLTLPHCHCWIWGATGMTGGVWGIVSVLSKVKVRVR